MVDEADSKSVGVTLVWVRVPPPAPLRNDLCMSGSRAGRARLDSKGLSSFQNRDRCRWIAGLCPKLYNRFAVFAQHNAEAVFQISCTDFTRKWLLNLQIGVIINKSSVKAGSVEWRSMDYDFCELSHAYDLLRWA